MRKISLKPYTQVIFTPHKLVSADTALKSGDVPTISVEGLHSLVETSTLFEKCHVQMLNGRKFVRLIKSLFEIISLSIVWF